MMNIPSIDPTLPVYAQMDSDGGLITAFAFTLGLFAIGAIIKVVQLGVEFIRSQVC